VSFDDFPSEGTDTLDVLDDCGTLKTHDAGSFGRPGSIDRGERLGRYETVGFSGANRSFGDAPADVRARVTVTDVDIPFSMMFRVMLKWTFATILALCIVGGAGAALGFGVFKVASAYRASLH
jgi:hypothetical protein